MAKEDIIGQSRQVLDHGMVRVVDLMGDDSAVVQAARVSYGEGTKTVNEDRGLIRYLMRKHHSTPFEMAEIKLHCKMPIFVARQWIRHRTANVNEMSARYSILPETFYIPDEEQIAKQSQTNAQGRDKPFSKLEALYWKEAFREHSNNAYSLYTNMTDDGMARELARGVLPPNIYTEWYWKTDVHNLLHFIRLRADPHAQYEIRVFAEAILDMFKLWMPLTYEAFIDYRVKAVTFSAYEMQILRDSIDLDALYSPDAMAWENMSKREQRTFLAHFKK